MEEKELAYFAGFIDGEGCIGTCPQRGYGKRAHNTTPRQQIRLSATNVNKGILEDLRNTFGGWVGSHGRAIGNRKESWRWNIDSKRACEAIELLLPHLRIKKRQAMLCIELQETYVEASIERTYSFVNGKHRFLNNCVKPEVQDKRKAIITELTLLNKRGI